MKRYNDYCNSHHFFRLYHKNFWAFGMTSNLKLLKNAVKNYNKSNVRVEALILISMELEWNDVKGN